MISLLCPSRGRPFQFSRMVQGALKGSVSDVEVVCYLDDDDPTRRTYPISKQIRYVTGERTTLSDCWNRCYAQAQGDVLMHCGDDLIFRTMGWDALVMEAFDAAPDPFLFVHGDDRGPHGLEFGTHGFVTRPWVETLGYFLPPIFSCDWGDVWLNEVANILDRRVFVEIVTEHMHPNFGKGTFDKTHEERVRRGHEDDVVALYESTSKDRIRDAKKIRKAMETWTPLSA